MGLLQHFIFALIFARVCSYSEFSRLLEIALNLQDEFAIPSALFVSDINNDTDDTSLLVPLKLYSSNNKFSITINLKNLVRAINLYDTSMKPFLIIFLKSSEDFGHLTDAMKQRYTHNYWWLIIFTMELDDMSMNICLHPQKNYFNVFYNAKIFVLCNKNDKHIINEWYSLYPDKMEVLELASWSKERGLVFSNSKDLLKRRKSLKGVSLRVTDIEKYSVNQSSNISMGGLFQDVLELIAVEANFTISYQKSEKAYGVYNATTKQWDGLLGKVMRNETDVAIGEIAQTIERSIFVDFSLPIIPSYLNYYLKKSNNAQNLQWSMYYKPFSLPAGICLIFILIIGALTTTYIKLNKNQLNNMNTNNVSDINISWKIIQDSYLDSWAIFCNMQILDTTTTSSLKIAYSALYILSFIIYAIYAAVLMSHSTVFKPKMIFNSLQEFINDGSYQITVVKQTSYMNKLYNEKNALSKKLKRFVLNYNDLKSTVGGAIDQVCSGQKVIFLMDDWGIKTNMPPDCELVAFDQEHLVNMAFAFMKNSPYTSLFNYYLQKFKDYGILHFLRKRYETRVETIKLNYESVSLITTIPIFFLLLFGIGLSVFILICEKIHFQIYSMYATRHHEFVKSKTNYWKPLIR